MTTTTDNQTTQAQWDAANRFLDQLFLDPTLANSYLEISQQANGQDNAPEMLTTWLQEQGYDTTPDLVYDALIALQNTSLTYWSGVYGQSFFEGSRPAPVLAIAPNAEGNTVAYLDGVELKNFVFESVETDNVFHPVLSWNLDSNETAGKITFYYTSGVTLDSEPPTGYTGNWFEGTLQTSVSSVSQKYYGAIGEPMDSSAIPQLILADGEGESWWDKYSTYVYVGIGAIAFIVSAVIIGTLVYRKRRVPEINFDRQDPLFAREPLEPQVAEFCAQQVLKRKGLKTTDQWMAEVFDEQPFINDTQRLAFKNNLQKAKDHFGDKPISKPTLLKFISDEKEKELSTGRYVDEDLDQLISKLTGIPLEIISPLLASSGQNDLMSNHDWLNLIQEGQTNNYFNNPQINNENYQTWLDKVKTQLKEASSDIPKEVLGTSFAFDSQERTALINKLEKQPLSKAEKNRLVTQKKVEINEILGRQNYQNSPTNTVNAEIEIRQLLKDIIEIDPEQIEFKRFLEDGTYGAYGLSKLDKELLKLLFRAQDFSKEQWQNEFNQREDAHELRQDWRVRKEAQKANKKAKQNSEQVLIQSMLIDSQQSQRNENEGDLTQSIIFNDLNQPQPPDDFQALQNQKVEPKEVISEAELNELVESLEWIDLTLEEQEQRKREFADFIKENDVQIKRYYVDQLNTLKGNKKAYNDKLAEIEKSLEFRKGQFISGIADRPLPNDRVQNNQKSDQNKFDQKVEKPSALQQMSAKPGDKSSIGSRQQQVISSNENAQKLDDKKNPINSDKKLEESKKNDPKKIDSTSHEVKPREGFK